MKVGSLVLAIALATPTAAAEPSAAVERAQAALSGAKAQMMADPNAALVQARIAARFAAALPRGRDRSLVEVEAHWLEGEALTRVNRPDAAKPVIDEALGQVASHAPRSKLHGDLLMSSAAIEWMSGQVKEALADFQKAHEIYQSLGEARSQAKALQYIGTIYFDARDYPRMLRYYRQSEETYRGDPALTISALNNQGDALKEMKRFPEAIAHYRRALAIADKLASPVLGVRILTNIASAHYQAGNYPNADRFADQGLARAAGKDTGWEQFLWGVKAQSALARGDLDAAQRYVDQTFAGADLAKTTVQMREFHETAYRLYQRTGNYRLALVHLAAFKRLDDEARDVTASTVSALLAAQFDLPTKNSA